MVGHVQIPCASSSPNYKPNLSKIMPSLLALTSIHTLLVSTCNQPKTSGKTCMENRKPQSVLTSLGSRSDYRYLLKKRAERHCCSPPDALLRDYLALELTGTHTRKVNSQLIQFLCNGHKYKPYYTMFSLKLFAHNLWAYIISGLCNIFLFHDMSIWRNGCMNC